MTFGDPYNVKAWSDDASQATYTVGGPAGASWELACDRLWWVDPPQFYAEEAAQGNGAASSKIRTGEQEDLFFST